MTFWFLYACSAIHPDGTAMSLQLNEINLMMMLLMFHFTECIRM